jgi:hypothetical protein
VESVIQNGSLAVNPIKGDQMTQIGRYQLSVRTLLFIPAILAISRWLTIRALDREIFQELAEQHENEALSYQMTADSPIQDRVLICALGTDRRCRRVEIVLSEAEILEAKRLRERAGRCAAHHQALERKYAWAAWFPWLPVATDPPDPE